MSKEKSKLPTPAELNFYRSKVETGSHIGTRQLAAVFAALDDAEGRAQKAEQLLFMAETCLGPRTTPGMERILAAYALMDAMREAGYQVDPPREEQPDDDERN